MGIDPTVCQGVEQELSCLYNPCNESLFAIAAALPTQSLKL